MNMLNAVPGFQVAAPGVITRRNYATAGYQRVLRGVYGRGPVTDQLDKWERRRAEFIWRVNAVMSVYAPTGAVLYGPTALQVLGVELPTALEDWDNVHILVPHGGSRGPRSGVVVHQARHPLVVWRVVHGVPVLHPVEHWLQLRGASDDHMVEVGDGFLRRRGPLLTVAEMGEKLARCSGWTGTKQARRVFPLLRARTDSLPETTVRLILVRAGLPTPAVNPEVYCPGVGIRFSVDMGYERERIAVEYDGGVHGDNVEQMRQDALKRRVLQDERWLVITVTAPDLGRTSQIANSVETALVMRRASMAR